MPGNIRLDALTDVDNDEGVVHGMVLSATLFPDKDGSDVHLAAEMSDRNRDVRVVGDSSIVRVRVTRDGRIRDVLVDDVPVWER